MDGIMFFYGNSNPELGKKIAGHLKIPEGQILIKKFANDETYIQLLENVRGKDVFIMQTGIAPINDNLMEMLIMIDAAKRASAERITAIMPNYFYSRQDRKSAPREPISAKLVADLLETAGADRVLTLEVHSDQIHGFFDIPFDNLAPKRIFLKKAREVCPNQEENVVVAADAGEAKKATKISKSLGCGLAIINKFRSKHNEAEGSHILGDDVKGKNCLLFDDMLDTGGSLCLAAKMLKENGAGKIYAFITHGLFSKDAKEKIANSEIDKVFITNTIAQEKTKKIEVIDVSDYFADAIYCIHNNKSVSELFDKGIEEK